MPERETRLKKAIEAIDTYDDYILVDCPPSLGLLTVNAMAAVDEVLIPIQCGTTRWRVSACFSVTSAWSRST